MAAKNNEKQRLQPESESEIAIGANFFEPLFWGPDQLEPVSSGDGGGVRRLRLEPVFMPLHLP